MPTSTSVLISINAALVTRSLQAIRSKVGGWHNNAENTLHESFTSTVNLFGWEARVPSEHQTTQLRGKCNTAKRSFLRLRTDKIFLRFFLQRYFGARLLTSFSLLPQQQPHYKHQRKNVSKETQKIVNPSLNKATRKKSKLSIAIRIKRLAVLFLRDLKILPASPCHLDQQVCGNTWIPVFYSDLNKCVYQRRGSPAIMWPMHELKVIHWWENLANYTGVGRGVWFCSEQQWWGLAPRALDLPKCAT